MQVVVGYESMFGQTRQVAQAIADGLARGNVVVRRRVGELTGDDLVGVGLLVLGGPTHAWSMSRARTRAEARRQASRPGSGLELEPGADGPGVREWLASWHGSPVDAAAFDTRVGRPRVLTGAASRGIAHALQRHGCRLVMPPESFVVDAATGRLADGERERARAWGERLAALTPFAAPR